MKRYIVILILCLTNIGFAQQKNKKKLERIAREEVRKGNELYNQLKFKDAEVAYKKALDNNPNYPKASYNLGNAIYQQNRTKEAISQYELVEKMLKNKMSKAEAFHNMGNTFMKAKQYAQAVEAYKNSLRNNSKDDETRYNLALAQKMLKNQQKQNKNNKNNKDKKNKDNKNNKNKNNKDKKNKDKDNKDNKKDKDKGKDKKDDKGDSKKNNPKDQKKQPPKPRPNQLSPEQMKQLLDAMNNEENKTQKKLNAKKASAKKIKQEKDW
ncbi:MAG: tetratricopeptide repeat protein [Lutibacter sp.]|uniref:tetratricopeptide repeat protein n=1 Tax=Lutibacter sp. TaxID=1925666 RepID=UPI00299DDB96|nr:tetratricopeptide repeat protein [Lutibacter sp.]MDX1830077.1 tetratricopeptide repeat protein [Lutibacter sp.]